MARNMCNQNITFDPIFHPFPFVSLRVFYLFIKIIIWKAQGVPL